MHNRVIRFIPGEFNEKLVQNFDLIAGLQGEIKHPTGLCLDYLGRLIITDTGNNRILRYKIGHEDPEVLFGGTYGNGLDQLSYPQSSCIDSEGRIYVSDRENHRIIRFSPGESHGVVVAGGNGRGIDHNQLM